MKRLSVSDWVLVAGAVAAGVGCYWWEGPLFALPVGLLFGGYVLVVCYASKCQ